MSLFLDGVDPFEGLRVLPREPAELRHHLSHINHTLQTRYFVAKETAEFALMPEKTVEFTGYYEQEINRIVAHLNRTTRKPIKVRVDPRRIAKGLEVRRAGDEPNTADDTRADTARVDPVWAASMTKTGEKLAHQYMVEQQRLLMAGAVTPANQYKSNCGGGAAAGGGTGMLSPDQLPTGATDSDARPRKSSCLFSTPPEFKGFNVPLATPSESDRHSPRAY